METRRHRQQCGGYQREGGGGIAKGKGGQTCTNGKGFGFGWWAHNAIYWLRIMDMYTWNLCNLLTNATPTHLIRENFKGKMILKVNREKRRIANREYGCSRPSRKKKKKRERKTKISSVRIPCPENTTFWNEGEVTVQGGVASRIHKMHSYRAKWFGVAGSLLFKPPKAKWNDRDARPTDPEGLTPATPVLEKARGEGRC